VKTEVEVERQDRTGKQLWNHRFLRNLIERGGVKSEE